MYRRCRCWRITIALRGGIGMERGGIVLGCHGGGVVVRRCCRAEGGVVSM